MTTTNPTAIALLEEGLRAILARSKPSDQDQRSRFAAGVGPVMQGMLAVARADSAKEHLQVTTAREGSQDFTHYPASSKMVVLTNPPAPGCCDGLTDRATFSSRGELGLKAVIYHESREIDLLLPQWTRSDSPDAMDGNAYTIVRVAANGYTEAHLYQPLLNTHGLLRHALGTTDQLYTVIRNSRGGGIDSALGFPGAADFLAAALPKLGTYLEQLAKVLGGTHQH